MPLPQNFNDWEHFQSTLISVQNKRIREEFAGEDDDSISTPRSSLKQACLLKDNDSAIQTMCRLWMFYVVLGQASALHPPIYSMPVDLYQQSVKFQPQVTLLFREDVDDVEEGFVPIKSELSFRIRGKTEDNISQADLRDIATRIRSEFASGAGYRWRKGRISMTYRDLKKGYRVRVQAASESEGREVIGKILDLQGDTIDRSKITINTLDEAPPIIPPTRSILGKSRRLPRRRPVGWVRFLWAEAHVWGVPNSIVLIDRTGRRRNPLITAR